MTVAAIDASRSFRTGLSSTVIALLVEALFLGCAPPSQNAPEAQLRAALAQDPADAETRIALTQALRDDNKEAKAFLLSKESATTGRTGHVKTPCTQKLDCGL